MLHQFFINLRFKSSINCVSRDVLKFQTVVKYLKIAVAFVVMYKHPKGGWNSK